MLGADLPAEVVDIPLGAPCVPGRLDPANARHVLAMLDRAIDGCTRGEFAAMVTAPVQKSIINDAGVPFTGHTEYLAERTGARHPVMLLAADTLRVALATTHLPLRAVGDAETRIARNPQTFPLLEADLRRCIVRGFPHSLLFRLDDDGVLVVAVAHQRRRPGYWHRRVRRRA